MLENFFKTALRVFWKRKTFSLINVFGLAMGVAASLLIFVVIHNELSYDNYHSKESRIYRLITSTSNKGNKEITNKHAEAPAGLPDVMRKDFPQAEKVGGIWIFGSAQLYIQGNGAEDEKKFKQNGGLVWSDPQTFEIFDHTWVTGDAQRLSEPNTVVIDDELATRFFGDPKNALGKIIKLWSFRVPLNVVGVFKTVPTNTDLAIKLAGSAETLKKLAPGLWTDGGWQDSGNGMNTFLLLPENASPQAVENSLASFEKKYFKEVAGKDRKLSLQKLSAMHLAEDVAGFSPASITKKQLWTLALIGVFLLLVACINFINLSTAQSINRAKEIGVRKVLGSNRGMLISQFMQETGLIAIASVTAGFGLAVVSLPLLSSLMKKTLHLEPFNNPVIIVYLAVITVMVNLLAGLYPAMILSGFKPAVVFKYKNTIGTGGGISMRRSLVVFQFVIAQLLIMGTVIVIKQMNFVKNKNLGFQKDGIVLVNLPSDSALKTKYPLLTNRMRELPGVVSVSLCMEAVSGGWVWDSDFIFDNETEKRDFKVDAQVADTGYYKTFDLELVAGRIPFASDTAREFVVNEALVKSLNLNSPEEIIGKTISMNDWVQKATIVGVIKNYNNRSLREAIHPLVLTTQNNSYEWMAIRMERKNIQSTKASVKNLFSSIYPTYLYDQVDFNERLERFYENEEMVAKLFQLFAFLAIFISCLGLYGLVSFMTVQKTREVGIRKVLGASIQSIVMIFSREFTLLVLIAFVIAAPVGYYFMTGWLEGFYFRIDIEWTVFLLTIFLSIVIAWLTVGYKAFKAALRNPVQSIKVE